MACGVHARGEDDVLSDLDVVVSLVPHGEATFVPALPEIATRFGPVAIENHVPRNAPLGGYFLAVLYDVEPLPVYCDWSVWPSQPFRPSDARVVFERGPGRFSSGPTFDEMMAASPRAEEPLPFATDNDRCSRFYMVPIVAKDAVRGWLESVEIMKRYLPFEVGDMSSTECAIAELSRVVDQHGQEEPAQAGSAVKRYLERVVRLVEPVAS